MRALVAWSVGLAAGIFGFTAATALTGSWLVGLLIAAAVAIAVALLMQKRPIVPLDGAAASRVLLAVITMGPQGVTVLIAVLACGAGWSRSRRWNALRVEWAKSHGQYDKPMSSALPPAAN